jgi:hypothetical protein
MDSPIIFWILFNAFVLIMLALDLGFFISQRVINKDLCMVFS